MVFLVGRMRNIEIIKLFVDVKIKFNKIKIFNHKTFI